MGLGFRVESLPNLIFCGSKELLAAAGGAGAGGAAVAGK